VWDWPDPAAGYGRSTYFTPVVALHDTLQPTLLFWPGLWLALAIAAGVFAWPVRSTPAGAFTIGVTASAVVYVMTFFVVGVASDFRYAYWCVLATLAGGVAATLARTCRATPRGQDSCDSSAASASTSRM
jgi:hypothetical protein